MQNHPFLWTYTGYLIHSMQVEAAEMIDELVTPVKLHQLHQKRAPESTQKRDTPHL
ncbi:MAG: hypothetical protein MUO58_12765 [Anaerolineales bacterium]|nr:hypothetical protein [Anaerolineales bacterium]